MYIYKTVETLAKSLEDAIGDGLSVKLAKTASYVTTRRSCACRAQGSHIETESNGTFFQFLITGNDVLDHSTFCSFFRIECAVGKHLRPFGGPELL